MSSPTRGQHVRDPEEEPPEEGDPRSSRRKRKRSFLAELPGLLLTALAIAVVIKTFLIQPFWIPSASMEDTIQINDRVMVNKLAYNWGDPQRGDIVVFRDPREPELEESIPEAIIRSILEAVGVRTRGRDDLIKRVIGLPGETVSIKDSQLYIDGEPLEEPYLLDRFMSDEEPFTVPEGEVFVMGDNRNASFDSRRFGSVSFEDLVGKAFLTIWPLSSFGGL